LEKVTLTVSICDFGHARNTCHNYDKFITEEYFRVTKRFEKNCPFFQKVVKTASKPKNAKISTVKLNLKVQKHQTTPETLKYLKQTSFETAYYGKNVMYLLKQKLAQNVAISLVFSSFQKIIMSLQK
jgi:hypothetical protein